MLMRVKPHDLIAHCAECNTTLAQVSQQTKLSEEVLLAFARGELPLSAHDRFAIFMALTRNLPPRYPEASDGPYAGWMPISEREVRFLQHDMFRLAYLAPAIRKLAEEMEQEDASQPTHKM